MEPHMIVEPSYAYEVKLRCTLISWPICNLLVFHWTINERRPQSPDQNQLFWFPLWTRGYDDDDDDDNDNNSDTTTTTTTITMKNNTTNNNTTNNIDNNAWIFPIVPELSENESVYHNSLKWTTLRRQEKKQQQMKKITWREAMMSRLESRERKVTVEYMQKYETRRGRRTINDWEIQKLQPVDSTTREVTLQSPTTFTVTTTTTSTTTNNVTNS